MGEETVTGVGDFLLSQGWSGVVTILLLGALVRIFYLYEKVQEKRITESTRNVEVLLDVKRTLDDHRDLLRELLRDLRDMPRRGR